MTRRHRLLLCNDDGIDAPGIQALHAALRRDYDVLVVAPKRERSASGCALSLVSEMEVTLRTEHGRTWGYSVDGTPADCVKFALTAVPDFRPEFVLSGINRGMNAGNCVFYSGTVAGAIEATLYGFPAMACSLATHGHAEHHYADAAQAVKALLPRLLALPFQARTFWNLNLPNVRAAEMKGLRMSSHGTAFFGDRFELYREDDGVRFYKNVGTSLLGCERNADADDRMLEQGFAALSLLSTDLTMPMADPIRAHFERDLDAALRAGR